MALSDTPRFTAPQIAERVSELAVDLSRDLAGRDVVAIIVLKGGLHFGSDLIRRLTIPMTVDFIRAVSYQGAQSRGNVEFLVLPTVTLAGRDVLIVEDILDTGRTAQAILERVRAESPARVHLCTLFDKAARRAVALEPDYAGFRVGEAFLVGYGMDYDERYRELPEVYVLESGD